MAVPKGWVPNGWRACKASCTTRPKTGRRNNKTYVWCDCVDACLNENRCGCRLVRRKQLGNGKFGPVQMVEITCGGAPNNRPVKEAGFLYRCYCLERLPDEKRLEERRKREIA